MGKKKVRYPNYDQIPTIWLKKIVKIGPVDTEIIGLQRIIKNNNIKRKRINASKTRSPFGKHAARVK